MRNVKASIPGWLDAIQHEAECHESAIAHPHDGVCGVPIRHLSLIDLARMREPSIDNCFFNGNYPSEFEFMALPQLQAHAVDFLVYQHVKSTTNSFVNTCRRYRYRRLDMATVYADITQLLTSTYLDALGASDESHGRTAISFWAGSVDYVDLIATEYGWTDTHIENMPYRKLIQCVRKILKRRDPKQIISSSADRVVSRWQEHKAKERN